MPPISTRFAAVLVLFASPLCAQTIRGNVFDSSTSRPLASVTIELVHPGGQVIMRETTGRDGRFSLRAREAGAYRVRAQVIGYRPLESSAVILAPRRDTTLELRMAAVPVQLDPVTVEAARSDFLVNRGYYSRKETERGTFLDPAVVEKKASKAKLATDILLGIPGVSIVQNVPRLRTCRSVGSSNDTHPFAPRIYIDGVESGSDIIWSLQPNDILAVELYMGPAQIPLQYGGTNTPCGIILIWTKH